VELGGQDRQAQMLIVHGMDQEGVVEGMVMEMVVAVEMVVAAEMEVEVEMAEGEELVELVE